MSYEQYRNFLLKDVQVSMSRENWKYEFKIIAIHLPTATRVEAFGEPLEELREKALKTLDVMLDKRSESLKKSVKQV